jgi:hypothetical protein
MEIAGKRRLVVKESIWAVSHNIVEKSKPGYPQDVFIPSTIIGSRGWNTVKSTPFKSEIRV